MQREDDFLRVDNTGRTWQRYCGFLDISIEEFMQIQRSLLHDQLELIANSPLTGKLTGKIPNNLGEFRSVVPLTTYDDYTYYLNNSNEASLNVKPAYWIFTSWTRGTYKWIPWTPHFDKVSCQHLISALIIAAATRKGEVNLRPKDKMLLTMPPRPFASASLAFSMLECSSFQPILTLEEAERVTLNKKIEMEFYQALAKDIDFVICMSSILHRTTKEYVRLSSKIKPSWRLLFNLHPKVLFRLVCAFIKGRVGEGLIPKDLWSPKAIISWGTDTAIYQDEISQKWGKLLYHFYVTSEAGFLATQSWTRRGLTFFPDSAFLEFIPQDDGASQKTLLLDELEPGKKYELVVTSFYGMPLLRCRLGDLIRVVSLADDQAGINLPQITIEGRNDQVVDLHSIARLDTETISMAMNGLEVECKYWVACKEYDHGDPILRFYIELEENTDHLPDKINGRLKKIDKHYREAVYTMNNNPIRVTSLPKGSLQNSELNHQVNVSTSVIQQLNSIRQGGE
jgi:hypothetical protein